MAMVLASHVAVSVQNYYSDSFTPKPKSKELANMCRDILKEYSEKDLGMDYD